MLRVIEPPTSTALTTIQAVRPHLTGEVSDEEIAELIRRASDAIADWCGHPFGYATYEERVPGYGTQMLTLRRRPVIDVISVLFDNVPVIDWELADPEAGLLYRKVGWTWTVQWGWGLSAQPVAGTEEPRFTVRYRAGYLLPGQEAPGGDGPQPPPLPGSVEEAVLITVTTWHQQRGRDRTVAERRIADTQVRYDRTGPQNLPQAACDLLIRYREVRW